MSINYIFAILLLTAVYCQPLGKSDCLAQNQFCFFNESVTQSGPGGSSTSYNVNCTSIDDLNALGANVNYPKQTLESFCEFYGRVKNISVITSQQSGVAHAIIDCQCKIPTPVLPRGSCYQNANDKQACISSSDCCFTSTSHIISTQMAPARFEIKNCSHIADVRNWFSNEGLGGTTLSKNNYCTRASSFFDVTLAENSRKVSDCGCSTTGDADNLPVQPASPKGNCYKKSGSKSDCIAENNCCFVNVVGENKNSNSRLQDSQTICINVQDAGNSQSSAAFFCENIAAKSWFYRSSGSTYTKKSLVDCTCRLPEYGGSTVNCKHRTDKNNGSFQCTFSTEGLLTSPKGKVCLA